MPSVRDLWRIPPLFWWPFRRTSARPGCEQPDFVVVQSALIRKIAVSCLWWPRWHVALFSHSRDLRRVAPSIFIREERERADSSRVVARSAMLIDDGRDVAIKRHGSSRKRHGKEHQVKP